MQLFYSTEIVDNHITLSEEESKHCVKVLRKRIGDKLHVTDGNGNLFLAQIENDSSSSCQLRVIETLETCQVSSYYLHLVIAPTKNPSRIEWLLEKLVEIGVDEVSLILCEHSEKQKVRIDRLEKILVSAMKQSLNYKLPKLNEPIDFASFIANTTQQQRIICWCETGAEDLLINTATCNMDTVLLIGPEGDFSKQEVELALQHRFRPVSLGKQRFRTETAGLVATQMVHDLNSFVK